MINRNEELEDLIIESLDSDVGIPMSELTVRVKAVKPDVKSIDVKLSTMYLITAKRVKADDTWNLTKR